MVRFLHPGWVLYLVGALLIAGCDTSTDQVEALRVAQESEHFVYHFAEGDVVRAEWQEAYYEWVVEALGIAVTEKLHYHKYRDRPHLRSVTGRNTNGFAEIGTLHFHTIWPIDNHESVHTLVLRTIGHPPALFNEGIAVAHHMDPAANRFTPQWSGRDLDVIAREKKQVGQIPPLESLIESRPFFDFDTNLTYPLAGSFVRFLIDSTGIDLMKDFIGRSTFEDSEETVRRNFLAVYGSGLDQWWQAWLAVLDEEM